MLTFKENCTFKSQLFIALYVLFMRSPLSQLRENWKRFSHFFNVALLGLFNRCLLQTRKIFLAVLGSWSVGIVSICACFFVWLCIWCQINRFF